MIKTINKQTQINATSVVTVEGPTGEVEVPVLYMQATIQPDGKIAINQAIQNENVYLSHLEEASKDYNEFYSRVLKLIQSDNK